MDTEACLSIEQILDLWQDRLSEEESAHYTRHLTECSICLGRAEYLSSEDDGYWAAFPKRPQRLEVPAWVEELVESVHPGFRETQRFLGLDADFDDFGQPFSQEHPDEPIGPYTLREPLGEGGMGIVYVATQTEPVRRTVALKIIKPGMDSREVIRRFESERQTLAMMAHPNIAKILDGGTTNTGRPYFVMELIEGVPITEFCAQQKLSLRERLELFRTVCLAVQHAHQKGIIHRDLKPTNIQVELHDGLPVPKVIDFGIAKAINPDFLQHSVYTQFAQVIGTPLYMSPEQATLSGMDIDTRSDVYSLGVILYELLTGRAPFEKALRTGLGFDEMRRIIREEDPARPSHEVSTLDRETLSTWSASCRTEPRQLLLSIRRELDWIVMKALEKDRNRRYESASALAQDIERYLHDEPTLACPPSAAYRIRKYVKRHRVLLGTTSLVLFSAILSTAFSLSFAHKANHLSVVAKTAQGNAEFQAKKAKQSAQQAREAEEWARTRLYASDMKLVFDALEDGDSSRAAELLNRHVPKAGQTDLRGFEWYYYHKQVHKPILAELDQGCWVDDLEASPDGQWLATTAAEGMVRIYETRSWTLQKTFPTGSDSVHGLAWSKDGQKLAAACGDGHLHVWELMTGRKLLDRVAHAEGANDVVFSSDGNTLFTCGEDCLSKCWDLERGEVQLVFKGPTKEVNQIALSPDGSTLTAVSSDGSFAVWDSQNANCLFHIDPLNKPGHRLVCVDFSPDGEFIVAGGVYGELILANVRDGSHRLLTSEQDGIEDVKFFQAGLSLATVNRGGTVHLYVLAKALSTKGPIPLVAPLHWSAHRNRALSLTTLDQGEVLVTGGRDNHVYIWTPDLAATTWSLDLTTPGDVDAVGNNRLIRTMKSEIEIWDLDCRARIGGWSPGGSDWRWIACSQNGRYLAAVAHGKVVLFDIPSQQTIRVWPLDPRAVNGRPAISPDGQFIAIRDDIEGHHDFVLVFDRDSSQLPLQLPAKQCDAVAFSPHGRWLAVGLASDLQLFDLQNGGSPRVFEGHTNSVKDIAFSPDGEWLASGGNDRLLKMWNLITGEEHFSIIAHSEGVKSVAFSPEGRTIATSSTDGQIHLWHAATGQPLGGLTPRDPFEGHVGRLGFSQDGKRLIARLGTDAHESMIAIFDAASISNDDVPNNLSTRPESTNPPALEPKAAHRVLDGQEWRVNTLTAADQGTLPQASPNVAFDGNGNSVITWSSFGQDGSDYGVYARRFDANGTALGTEFQVNTHATTNQLWSSVAMSDSGQFIITWSSADQDGSSWGIYAQLYQADGKPRGSEFRVNTQTASDQRFSSVAMNDTGQFVITWTSGEQDSSGLGIYAQRYDANGNAVGEEFQVNTQTAGDQQFSTVAMSDSGQFVITWTSGEQDGSKLGIYAQLYQADGTPLGEEFRVNTHRSMDQWHSRVAMNKANECIITWTCQDRDGSGFGVYAQRYDAQGNALGSEFRVNTHTSGPLEYASVAMNDTGRFLVTWSSQDQDGSGSGIYARLYDASGQPQGDEFRINTHTDGHQRWPSAAMTDAGRFVITWSCCNQESEGHDVYARWYEYPALDELPNSRPVLATPTDVVGNPKWMPLASPDIPIRLD